MSEHLTTFLRRLSDREFTHVDRWVAVLYWHESQLGLLITPLETVCEAMATAGYGRPKPSRVAASFSADTRVFKNGQGYSIRPVKLAHVDRRLGRYVEPAAPASTSFAFGLQVSEEPVSPEMALPTIFIGSSAEGLKPARALERQLQHHAEVTIWKDGVFGLSQGTLESLVALLPKLDFAALVLTPDDLVWSREHRRPSPRDNVVFEAGLFIGALGRERTFLVYNSDAELNVPTDLAGITPAKYKNRADDNYHAQLSPPSTLIIDAIEALGARAGRKVPS